MSRPWLRPHDGKYYLRKRTPARYRKIAGKAEFRIPLNTRDRTEAKARMPQALATWADMEARWERELRRETLTEQRAQEIAALWAAWITAGGQLDTGGEDSDVFEPLDFPELRTPERMGRIWARVEFHSQEALKIAEVTVTPASLPILAKAMLNVIRSAYLEAELRGMVVSRDGHHFRPLQQIRQELPEVSTPLLLVDGRVTFDDIWERWSKVTSIGARTIHETKGILKQLEAFLGHDDAAKVTKADLIRWRDAVKAGGKSNNTWNNRLSLIGQVFKRAVKDLKLPADPTEGLRLDKGKPNPWKPYSDTDTVAILQAARRETSPALRWAHWVMALSGMRVGEVLQLTGDDIAKDPKSGVWYMAAKDAPDEGKATKNSKPRHVPLHPSLIQEGFLAYAQGIKEQQSNAPLFPDKKPDRYGRLGGRAWNLVGTWVRKKVGITDPKKAPNHSWRHRMEDELRAAEVYEADRDAIIGHARKTVGAQYGVRGEALRRLHRELSKVHLPEGL